MKSLMTFVGILAFNLPNIAMSSDFSCPVNANVSNFTCSGTVKVKTLAELNAYRNDLGVVAKKPTIAKNLQIDFNPALTSDLVISTPCLIRIPSNVVMTSTANICLNGTKGIVIDENFKFTGKNLKLESKEEVIINKNSVIKAQDIKLLSIGAGDASKTYIRDGANVEAANLSIESFDKGFIGKNSIVKLTGALGIYSLGDDEASVREGARVEAAKIEISSTEETRVAKLTTLIASEIILNGVKCTINKTAVITADDRLGNCFLTSTTNKAKFSINKNQGTTPLAVSFNASSIVDAKGFVWSFGDGETLNSLTPNVTHIYSRVGSFTATLKYATKDNYKGLKSAGAIQIDVKEAPISNPVVPVPPRGNLKYQTDGTFLYLRGYIRKTTYDIANAYYVIDDNQNNKIQIPNFYQNSLTSVELNTYGRHKVTMNVVDVQGLTHSKSMNVFVDENEEDVYPYMRLDVDQSAARTMFFDLSWSFNPIKGETLKNFKIDFGDGQTAVLTDTAFITHTYAQAGTYLVRGTGEVNGNEDFDEYEIEVTDENTEIMNPVAGFEYQIHDYAGNVMFTDDRSGTPNGEIISYAWDFGDGTVGYGKNASNFYAPGDYLVTLNVTDTAGLRSSQTQKITIVAEGDDIASMLDCSSDRTKHLSCEVVAFDKFNQITSVKLDWGDSLVENLTVPDFASTGFSIRHHNYQSYGLYKVRLTINTARGSTKIKEFEHENVEPVQIPPVANIYCSASGLLVNCNALGSYDPKDTELTYIFNYGDGFSETNKTGLSSHAFHVAGLFDITVTVKDDIGLSDTSVARVQVNVPQNLLPSGYLACETLKPLSLSCRFEGTDPDGYIVNVRYEFDDGSVKTFDPSVVFDHDYSVAGSHPIKLIITDNSGSQVENYQDFVILDNRHPVINGLYCGSNEPLRLSCVANAYELDSGDFITMFSWENEQVNPSYTITNVNEFVFQSPGEKTVKVTVTDSYGKTESLEKIFTVKDNSAPVISFFDCQNIGLLSINCQVYAHDQDGEIQKIKWLLDDGTSYEGSSITHTFTSGGTHTATVIVKDDLDKESTSTISLKLIENQLPTFDIKANNLSGSLPLLVEFEALDVKDLDGSIASYEWFVENQLVSVDPQFSHTFINAGIYNVKLRIIDNHSGMTEKSVVVRASDPSNIVILTDKDNGFANLNVSFDASESSDPDGEIIKFEWYLEGRKICESEICNYTFDQVGNNLIKLVVTNNFQMETEEYKEINVKMPAIYLSGQAPERAHVGMVYKASYDLVLSHGVDPENVSLVLEGEPDGLTFDDVKKEIYWIPNQNQIGSHYFKILLTDGILQSERFVRILVDEPRLLHAVSVAEDKSNPVIIESESILNGTQIILPVEEQNYSISIYESGDLDNPHLFFQTNVEVKKPLEFIFPSTMVYSGQVQAFMNKGERDPYYTYVENEDTRMKSCSYIPWDIKKIVLNDEDYNFLTSVSWRVTAHAHKNISKNPLLMKNVNELLNDINTLSKFPEVGPYKIKFANFGPTGKDLLGAYTNSLPDTIFINPAAESNKISSVLKFTLLHEVYHMVQNKDFGCGKASAEAGKSVTYRGVSESSADYNAIKHLDDSTRKYISQFPISGKLLTDREAAIYFSYYSSQYIDNIFAGLQVDLKGGLFSIDAEYNSRIFFDNNEINSEGVFNYFFNNQNKYGALRDENFGLVLISDYMKSIEKKVEDILIPLVENSTLKNSSFAPSRENSKIMYFIRNPEFFKLIELKSPLDYFSKEDDNTLSKEFELPAFSGINLNYSLKDLLGKLKVEGHADKVTLIISSSTANVPVFVSLKMQADINGNLLTRRINNQQDQYNISSFIPKDNNYGYDENFDLQEQAIFNIVNSGTVPATFKVSIKIECLYDCTVIPKFEVFSDLNSKNSYNNIYLNGKKKGKVTWIFGDGTSSVENINTQTKHVYENYGVYTVKGVVNLDYYSQPYEFEKKIELSPGKERTGIAQGATYYRLSLVNTNGLGGGMFHSRTANFKLQGPIGTMFSFGGSPDEINTVSCGAWTTLNVGPFPNSLACKRTEGAHWEAIASVHNVTQCGGWGCEGVDLYGFGIPYSSETVPIYKYTGEMPKPFDF